MYLSFRGVQEEVERSIVYKYMYKVFVAFKIRNQKAKRDNIQCIHSYYLENCHIHVIDFYIFFVSNFV